MLASLSFQVRKAVCSGSQVPSVTGRRSKSKSKALPQGTGRSRGGTGKLPRPGRCAAPRALPEPRAGRARRPLWAMSRLGQLRAPPAPSMVASTVLLSEMGTRGLPGVGGMHCPDTGGKSLLTWRLPTRAWLPRPFAGGPPGDTPEPSRGAVLHPARRSPGHPVRAELHTSRFSVSEPPILHGTHLH